MTTGACIFNFEITSYCNADCPSCFRTLYKESLPSTRHLKIEDFEFLILHNIKFFKNNQHENLLAKFCGEIGDPLLHPNIEQLISIAETVFDNVEIYTNGGLRNPKWIKNILTRYKKTRFVFGIDGLTDVTNQIYRDWKIEQKFSIKEIAQKELSLRGVMEPFSSKANLEIFKRAGFKDVTTIYKNICFEGFLCIK